MRKTALTLMTLLCSSSLSWADVKVVASIKPLHSLVAAVMQGVGTPGLIVDGSNSPHTYTMKPSDAKMLESAEIIFWVGGELEEFLQKPIETLGQKSQSIALADTPGIITLPVRENENFAADDDHDHEKNHNHDGVDGHIWLDPANAKTILKIVADTLSKADAKNAAAYKFNADKAMTDIDVLSAEIETLIAPARGHGYIVFHDAYQYFETRYQLPASGALSLHPENAPGAAKIKKLKAQIAQGQVKCVFSEPQFDTKLTNLLLEGSNAKTAVLDPLGATLTPGPTLYPQVMRSLATSLNSCLK
jgi:zinc transport system substrate-binding protein